MPRPVYTQAQANHTVACFEELRNNMGNVPDPKATCEPASVPHFAAKLRQVHAD